MSTAAALLVTAAAATADLRVIDGDTFAIGGETIRIVGLDAPELHGAHCRAEGMLAETARRMLVELLVAPRIDRVGRDRYGRTLARVTIGDGRDVAAIMIAASLAVAYDGGRRIDWCR